MVTNTNPGFDAGLAKFNSEQFANKEVFAGDTPLPVTLEGEAIAQNTSLLAFSVVGRTGNEPGGALVLANYVGAEQGDVETVSANKALTFADVPTANDTVTIDGVVYKATALGTAALNDYKIGATAAASAQNLADAINATPAALGVTTFATQAPHASVYASVSGAVVTVYAINQGTAGNSIIIAEAGTNTAWAGGATALSGGTDEAAGGITPIGVLCTDVVTGAGVTTTAPIFVQGCFDLDRLTWDVSFNTDAKKKSAFHGSPTPTNIVLRKRDYTNYFVAG